MEVIMKKNEAEINESVAKGLVLVFVVILLVSICCWLGIFDIAFDMTIILLSVGLITLIIPAIMILKIHVYSDVMKYIVVTMTAIMAGATYVLFTFQAVMIFVVPTIVAALYMNKRVLCYSGVSSVIVIIMSHFITGFYLFQPWVEPFLEMEDIMRYGAISRCLQYLGYYALVFFLVDRYTLIILREEQNSSDIDDNAEIENNENKIAFETMLAGLSEREKSVFILLVSGYTNIQIADKLYLSNGTVKNYISTIYEKIGTKERNALIMKFNRFVHEYDQSNMEK